VSRDADGRWETRDDLWEPAGHAFVEYAKKAERFVQGQRRRMAASQNRGAVVVVTAAGRVAKASRFQNSNALFRVGG
jgi:hypothetical protein